MAHPFGASPTANRDRCGGNGVGGFDVGKFGVEKADKLFTLLGLDAELLFQDGRVASVVGVGIDEPG